MNAWFDSIFFVGTPLLGWPLIMLAQEASSAELLTRLILLTATGHYFATFARAYGDKQLRARFRARLTILPVVLLFTCVWAFTNDASHPLLLVTGMWAFWHWLAQAFGFARIYDAKIGSFRPTTAFLDKALVVSWFLGAIVLNQSATANFTNLFINSGIALPGATFFATLRTAVLGLVITVTGAYAANLTVSLARGERVSWVKQFCHVMTIGFYWFAFGFMPNFFVSYVLYELFHDIQYFAIVWLSGRSRVQREGTTSWMRSMFQPGLSRAFLFVAVMVAFGAIDAGSREWFGDDQIGNVMKGVVIAAALLHYYYDGFIWRVRESDTRADLGIVGGAAGRVRGGLGHVVAWGFFFVPLVLLTARSSTEFSPMERARMGIGAAPESFETQSMYAHALVSTGDFENGLAAYAKSLEIYPGSARTQFNYAAALEYSGRLKDALTHYALVLECQDTDRLHAQAHVNMGVCLLVEGEDAAVVEHFRAGVQPGLPSPRDRMMALVQAFSETGRTERRSGCCPL